MKYLKTYEENKIQYYTRVSDNYKVGDYVLIKLNQDKSVVPEAKIIQIEDFRVTYDIEIFSDSGELVETFVFPGEIERFLTSEEIENFELKKKATNYNL